MKEEEEEREATINTLLESCIHFVPTSSYGGSTLIVCSTYQITWNRILANYCPIMVSGCQYYQGLMSISYQMLTLVNALNNPKAILSRLQVT